MCSYRHVILHLLAKFGSNRSIDSRVMMSYRFFKMVAQWLAVVLDLISVIQDHPRCVVVIVSFVLKYRLKWIYNFEDTAVFAFHHFGLKLHIHTHFHGFGEIFLSSDVTHQSNPKQDHPCTKTCSLSHKACKSVQQLQVGASAQDREKGKDDVKKS